MNATTNVTHLLWANAWIEAKKSDQGWIFKTGKDAARWLLWIPAIEARSEDVTA